MTNSIYLKLGSECNLSCKHCHLDKTHNFVFNEKVLPFIKSLNLRTLVFGGGEPLLHFDLISKIIDYLGKDIKYSFVTNGTLLTDEQVDFFNKNKVYVCISFDGLTSSRDFSLPIRWDKLNSLHSLSTACTFYKDDLSFETISKDLDLFIKGNPLIMGVGNKNFNFIHSTPLTGVQSSLDLAKTYIEQFCRHLEYQFILFSSDKSKLPSKFLREAFKKFFKIKRINGVRCCRDIVFALTISGDILACPYSDIVVGNIENLPDFNKVKEQHAHERCKACPLWDVCGDFCFMNITDHECYIMRNINKHFGKLMKKYGVTYEELNKFSKK